MEGPREPVDETLDYNRESYERHWANPLKKLRYELLYRQRRIAALLERCGVDLHRPGFRAFEYGFGMGHLLQVAAPASEVVGYEASSSAVARARAEAPAGHPGWQIVQHSDATALPLPSASFDLVTASHVLEHLPDDDAALDEWLRLVRPGGHLLILLPSNEVLFEGSKHLRTYDVETFCARLESRGLERIAVDEHQRFDWPFKHRYLILAGRRSGLLKLLIDAPRTLAFLPMQLVSWRLLDGVDTALSRVGAPSCSVAYLFRKRADATV